MQDVFDLMLYGFESIMNWMSEIEYQGISVLHVCFVALFLSLIWAFILSPLFGNRGGSLSIGASDFRELRSDRPKRSGKDENLRMNMNNKYEMQHGRKGPY